MKSISYLIKPVSSACNMQCRYCFYKDVSSHRQTVCFEVMNEGTVRHILEQSKNYDDVTFAFQGGEPMLAGLDFYKRFVWEAELVLTKQNIHYVLQTNGILIDEAWCAFFKEKDFLIGISLDGYKDNHDYFRKTNEGKNTFHTVFQALTKLRNYNVSFNILMVLTFSLAKHPQKLFQFLIRNRIQYVQLIPCLPEIGVNKDMYSLTPELFYSFYKIFFDLWYKEVLKGNYISVGLFDNLILLFQNKTTQQCGMRGCCSFQNIIESNGNVYPCDFYAVDDYVCGNINETNINEIQTCSKANQFINTSKNKSDLCIRCPFYSICKGNCKRMSVCYRNDTFCGYKEFLEYSGPYFNRLAQMFS